MGSPAEPRWIANNGELADLCAELSGTRRIGVDTEFHAERRYSPELMLVQVARPGGDAWVIDPRAVDPIGLHHLLHGREWVVWGGLNDLRVLDRAAAARPARVLDLQILAGMAGFGFPTRLSEVAAAVLGRTVDKGPTMEDWARRPLRPEQLRYAAEDARIVLELEQAFSDHARLEWAWMAGDELIAEVVGGPDPDAGWLTLDVAHKLTEMEKRRLSAILRWRERVAEERNQPTNSVIGLGAAIELVRRCPTSLVEMGRNRRISSGFVRNYGEPLVALLKDPPGPLPPSPPDNRERLFARLLQLWAEGLEGEGKIAASLLMPEGLRFRLAQGQDLFGWRREAVGEKYAKLRSGELQIWWGGDGLCMGEEAGRKNIFQR